MIATHRKNYDSSENQFIQSNKDILITVPGKKSVRHFESLFYL